MRRDRVALFLALGVPLIAFALLAWTFSNVVIRDLRVSIVDADRTPTSRLYRAGHRVGPGRHDRRAGDDLTSAMHDIRSGDAIASVYIPPDFERDVMARKRPADRRLLQPAIFHRPATTPRARCRARSPPQSPRFRGHRQRAALRSARVRSIVEQYVLTNPAAQLCAVPAARHPADRAARHHRDRWRLRGRVGILDTQLSEPGLDAPAAARWRR